MNISILIDILKHGYISLQKKLRLSYKDYNIVKSQDAKHRK